tara:strand:+ start:6145 stop:6711 length:567 start_codon:yes stop_codon:yes gene_type:complete
MDKIFRNNSSKIICIFILFLGYFYVTPYISLFLFKSSIESKNFKRAKTYISFTSLRNSLKPQFKYYLKDKIREDYSQNSITTFEFMLLDPVINVSVDSIVNSVISLKGLKLLIEKGELIYLNDESRNNQILENSDSQNQIKLYYTGINTFILTSEVKGLSKPLKVQWQRSRVFSWKLVSIELPSDIFN